MSNISRKECNQCMKELEEKFDEKIDAIYKVLAGKVSFKTFTWVLSTILGLYVVISAAIWFDLKEVRNSVSMSALAINSIQTVLNQAEITK
jgi:hypothetical protein